METFRDHLCPDQNVDPAGPEIAQSFAVSFFARHRVSVHPAHVRFWEKMRNGGLDFLGPEARVNQRVFSALGAFLRHGGGVPAKMATQSRHVPMERERDAAVRAIPRFAAIAAEQRGRKSASIQKQ